MAVVVVVDDDPTIRMIAAELLREGEHEVVAAADGDEALRVLAGMKVDLVVMDMLMPNKDGLETIIEARGLYPDLRILAISSGGRVGVGDLLRMARLFGADETYVKPLRMDTFGATVDRLLAEARPTVDILVAEAR
jgi:CheY-like chemotaxis protein